jgi:hypothetical protein
VTLIIAAENVVGIHKKDGALVVNNGESLAFCRACLKDVPDVEVDFDEQRPCVICQLPGGPALHARVPGQKHDYVTPQPEVVPFSDVELSESRAQVDHVKSQTLKSQLLRLYATVDYWISEARREADLRQPALDERNAAQEALRMTLNGIEEAVKVRTDAVVQAAVIEALANHNAGLEALRVAEEQQDAEEAARLTAARREWSLPIQVTANRFVVFTFSTYDVDALNVAVRKED